MKNSFVERLKAQTEQEEEAGKFFGFDPQANGRAADSTIKCNGRGRLRVFL